MQTLSATQAFRVRLTGRPLRAGLSGFAPSRMYPDTIRRLLVTAQVISLEGGIDRSRLSTSQRVNGTAR